VDRVENILSDAKYSGAVDKFLQDFDSVLQYAFQRYSPTCVIVGGGVVEMAEYWWDKLRNRCSSDIADRLVKAKLGNKAALMGSVYAALNGRYGIQNGLY
ncbi:MAG: hypothetical protein K2I79_02915, partial [Clostridia bacterium]|nr:hypothetical protein [Clostridia bacterium]